MMDLILKGGPLMWLLLGCSILTIAISLERYFQFHRARVDVGDLLHGLRNLIRNRNYAEALHECAGTPGPVARVIHSAIIRHDAPRSELKEIVQESGQLEVPKVEKYLAVLLSVAYVAPLIGLLGTVLGLVNTFVQVNAAGGYATATEISKGVYMSLITSAAGLMVAIPAFVFYSFLRAYAKTLMHDMERAGIEIVNIICDLRRERSDIIALHPNRPAEEDPGEEAGAAAGSNP
ncbi:MAG: MotA/TolQ/ExbB proton channel family protein [Verrucomicrobiae bacterium]|nr:MotA/TolQ/ExbB proton channel family protein [Verrucomicrobiae bacterium]MCP5540077.1 MotA/TolQ/ExbB proton channel family protein [Akkermansiaceae bacterium]